jgi:cytidylate kinase
VWLRPLHAHAGVLLLSARSRALSLPQRVHCVTGAVLDGRDIGTVICPDAAVKLYVTADVGVRAQRRLAELLSRRGGAAAPAPAAAAGGSGGSRAAAGAAAAVSYEAVLADMQARDDRDMNRATAPLKPAGDAVMLDTTHMDSEQAYQQARRIVEAALQAHGAAQQAAQQQEQQQPVTA